MFHCWSFHNYQFLNLLYFDTLLKGNKCKRRSSLEQVSLLKRILLTKDYHLILECDLTFSILVNSDKTFLRAVTLQTLLKKNLQSTCTTGVDIDLSCKTSHFLKTILDSIIIINIWMDTQTPVLISFTQHSPEGKIITYKLTTDNNSLHL